MEMQTIGAARSLGLQDIIGSLEVFRGFAAVLAGFR